jgi:hypothetical protein
MNQQHGSFSAGDGGLANRNPVRTRVFAVFIAGALYLSLPRRSHAEDSADAKFMYYAEEKGRINVMAPTFMAQHETAGGLNIKLEGIYNSISGATPTGAPLVPAARIVTVAAPAPVSAPVISGDDDHDDEGDDDRISGVVSRRTAAFAAVSGATPAAAPAPAGGSSGASSSPAAGQASVPAGGGQLPMADFSDSRVGLNLGISKRIGRHTPGTLLSFSGESDYVSTGVSLQDAIDFNKKNTTLLVGGAYTHDAISPANGRPSDSKDSMDLMLGISQVLTPATLLTANIVLGTVDGFISDPYKVVLLNNELVPEKRPETKDKQIVYLALDQFVAPLNGSVEASLRHYADSFGITAETVTLAWFQKIGEEFIVSPLLRYYTQSEADFYDVTFAGAPEFYSADFRVSAFEATSYGLQFIWMPTRQWSFDLGYERYSQDGTDGKTPQEAYVSANIIRAGVRLLF